jgi:hypothetical protein
VQPPSKAPNPPRSCSKPCTGRWREGERRCAPRVEVEDKVENEVEVEDGRRCAPQVEVESENEDGRRCAPQFEVENENEDGRRCAPQVEVEDGNEVESKVVDMWRDQTENSN